MTKRFCCNQTSALYPQGTFIPSFSIWSTQSEWLVLSTGHLVRRDSNKEFTRLKSRRYAQQFSSQPLSNGAYLLPTKKQTVCIYDVPQVWVRRRPHVSFLSLVRTTWATVHWQEKQKERLWALIPKQGTYTTKKATRHGLLPCGDTTNRTPFSPVRPPPSRIKVGACKLMQLWIVHEHFPMSSSVITSISCSMSVSSTICRDKMAVTCIQYYL